MAMRCTVFQNAAGEYSARAAPGLEAVHLELTRGWRFGASRPGQLKLVGPEPLQVLDLADAIAFGIAQRIRWAG